MSYFCDTITSYITYAMNISSEKLKQAIYEMSVNDSEDALKEIYLSFYSKLFSLAIYYVKTGMSAEEIVSDTFQAVWEQRAKLPEIYNFNAYVCQMVRNLSVSYLRKQIGKSKDIESIESLPIFRSNETPESKLISAELMDKLNEAIDNLPDRCKLVFKLVREENLKYKEVASMLNISLKTTETHMALAIKRLRAVIKKNIDSQG